MITLEEKAKMWDALCADNKIPCDVCRYEKFYYDMNKYSEELEKSLKFYEEREYGTPPYLKKCYDKILELRGSEGEGEAEKAV